MASGCTSVNVQRGPSYPGSPDLVSAPCTNWDPDHHGHCTDDEGGRWLRLSEHLRQRGQVLAGPRVRTLIRA